MPRPTLFLLHDLGSSARSWDGVIAALDGLVEIVALDLPGHGLHADDPGITVQETAERVATQVRDHEPDEWLVAGHGMGGRIAAIVTAWAERGERGLIAPAGLGLVDAVEPGPAPIPEERRAAMEGWWADGPIAEEHAVEYVGWSAAVPEHVRAAAIADVRRSNRTAWLEWLRRGSLEDWSDVVGVLRTPALVVVGTRGGAPEPLPHVAAARSHRIDGAGPHVLLERPRDIARWIADLVAEVAGTAVLPPAFARLIASDRVSARTRRVMLARLDEPTGDPRALTAAQHALLAAVLARVVPQPGPDLDLAGRLDADLAAGRGDGWRFAALPSDPEAWRRGLDTIAEALPDLASLDAAAQDAAIDRIAAGEVGSDAADRLTGAAMALWFQDVQAAAVRTWLSHPAAQAWIRYDGFADGGDGPRKQGFATTRAGEWEQWQRDWRTGEELRA